MEDRAEHKASQYLLFIIQYNTIPGRTDHLHSAGTPAAVSCICSVITELLLIIVENIRLFRTDWRTLDSAIYRQTRRMASVSQDSKRVEFLCLFDHPEKVCA